MPSLQTFPDKIRIRFRETPGKKNRGLELPSITKSQQALQPDL
jgi:hypothetical protein